MSKRKFQSVSEQSPAVRDEGTGPIEAACLRPRHSLHSSEELLAFFVRILADVLREMTSRTAVSTGPHLPLKRLEFLRSTGNSPPHVASWRIRNVKFYEQR